MYRRWPILLLLLFIAIGISAQDLGDHRSAQFATHGTDFWVTLPRWSQVWWGTRYRTMCVVAERDCDVTISNERLDLHHTFHVKSHYTISNRLDTLNFNDLPENLCRYVDTLFPGDLTVDDQPAFGPQNYGLHVTSTDTIALFFIKSIGSLPVTQMAMNILPTEMLRDEYVVQSYPGELTGKAKPAFTGPSFCNIVATEDSSTVDIILSCPDWMGHAAGDTLTVTLHRGQMYHLQAFKPTTRNLQLDSTHAFTPMPTTINTDISDISGTHIIARDCKRIAIFEGNSSCVIPEYVNHDTRVLFSQSIPIRYAGKEFIVPKTEGYLRFTGLVDSTTITITDASRPSDRTRTLHLDAYQTDWFERTSADGPYYVTSTQPVILKEYCSQSGVLPIIPIEWWNTNPIHNHTPFWHDRNGNRYGTGFSSQIFTRTEDVPYMKIDGWNISSLFHSISGTPYSYAKIGVSSYNSPGTHDIECTHPGFFIATMTQVGATNPQYVQSHIQPGGCYLRVNGIPAQQLPYDSIWCMYDPIHFHAWSERPADSIIWDFGDGTVQRYAYDDGQQVDYTYNTNGNFLMRRIITWRDESTEPCLGGRSAFTRTPDTMSVHINIRNHFDSTIIVRQCEGSYYFRDEEYAYTDTFYQTTYWTPSGCDTLWTIDLVTCPHCHYVNDTVSTADMPHRWGGISFGSEVTDYPIYISINDTCDSIIFYTLVVIKHWGEPPLDSTFILVPNIFTPGQETNNRFKIVANKFILEAQVNLFDRRGVKVAEFDGLTGDWDGTHDGIPLPQGSYIYYIRYRDTSVNGWKNLKGTVTLIR